MDIKESLRELNENFDLPPEEYKKLAGFKELEQQPDIVDSLLAARIPEVVKLACLSDMIPAGRFVYMKKLYSDISDKEIKAVLLDMENCTDFRMWVVKLSDSSILKKISGYFERLYCEYKALHNEEKRLDSEYNEILPKYTSQREIDDIKNGVKEKPRDFIKIKEKRDAAIKQTDELNSYIQQIKPYRECIVEAMAGYKNFVEKNRRYETACIVIDIKEIEKFLREYDGTQNVPKQYINNKDIANLLMILGRNGYDGVRVRILADLHKAGAVQLGNKAVKAFLLKYGNEVNDYLVCQLENLGQGALYAEENKILLYVLLRIEQENLSKSYARRDIDLWDFIKDEKIWHWIFWMLSKRLEEIMIVPVVASIFSRLDDNAEIFAKALLNYESGNKRISGFQVARELLSAGMASNRGVLLVLLDGLERRQAASRKEINILARRERARSQELFSALYQPVEQLEELTVNLMTNKENIPRGMIGSHLASTVISLREGLESMGLYPLVPTEDWQKQRTMPFSEEVHLKPMGNGKDILKVRLSTIGFKYEDEDGEEKKYLARVYDLENMKSTTSKKLQPGHHIGNRKGKKVNKQRYKTNNRNNYEVNRDDI